MSTGHKRPRWSIHNDLSGREWIPDNTIPNKPGWYENVPRRLYVHTPWGSLIMGERTQLWLPWKTWTDWRGERKKLNYSRFWSPIVWHPLSRERRRKLDEEYEKLDLDD